jgi:uncharacterized coiled-coil DUF342 family protein
MSDVYAEYRAKFKQLGEEIQKRKDAAADVQEELDVVNAKIEELRARQSELVEAKSRTLGGQSYLDLKKHYSALAKLLSGK